MKAREKLKASKQKTKQITICKKIKILQDKVQDKRYPHFHCHEDKQSVYRLAHKSNNLQVKSHMALKEKSEYSHKM